MRLRILAPMGWLLLVSIVRAGPAESMLLTAMKLTEASSYSWVSQIQDDACGYEISGKTDRSGYSLVSMPMISGRRWLKIGTRLASSSNVEAVYRGGERVVIRWRGNWKTLAELKVDGTSPYNFRVADSSWPPEQTGDPVLAYCNRQVAISPPHDQVAILFTSATDLKIEADTVTGNLDETGAKLLLVLPDENQIVPVAARGNFRLWLKDGMPQKYEIALQGTIAVWTNTVRHEIGVRQRSTTRLMDFGSTQFDIPEEAKLKLGR